MWWWGACELASCLKLRHKLTVSGFLLWLLFCFETGSYLNLLHRPGCPGIHRDSLVSDSQMLGLMALKACATMLSYFWILTGLIYLPENTLQTQSSVLGRWLNKVFAT